MGVVVESSLTDTPVEPYQASCSLADNLGDLDRLHFESLVEFDPANPGNIIDVGPCTKSLGPGLFLDLYHKLGREAFQRGFGNLYVKLEGEEHGECAGLEGGICYVEAAFTDGATPADAALAEEVIDKWYNGSPMK